MVNVTPPGAGVSGPAIYIGGTTVANGTNGYLLYNNNGVLGQISVSALTAPIVVGTTTITSGTASGLVWNNAGVVATGAALTNALGDITLPVARHFTVGTPTNGFGDVVAPFAQFGGYGGLSAPYWFGRGPQIDFPAQVYTDTTSVTGTVNSVYLSNWGESNIAFTVPTVVARAAMLKINPVGASTNATITATYCINTTGNNLFDGLNALGDLTPAAKAHVGGNSDYAAWTTTGKNLVLDSNVLGDTTTTVGSTVASRAASSVGAPTFAFNVAASTITDAYNVLWNGSVVAGTNATLSRTWAIGVRAGANSRFGESANPASTLLTANMGYITVISASNGGAGTAAPRGILLYDTSVGGSWDLVNPFAVIGFGSDDPTSFGAGERVRLGPVMEATNGSAARFGIFTAAATSGTFSENFSVTSKGNVLLGHQTALATNATDGFGYMRGGAGAPSGVPTAYTGFFAFYYDSSGNQLYIYNGGWKQPKTPAAAATITWQ